jgi:CheY-like chemotaxis protein
MSAFVQSGEAEAGGSVPVGRPVLVVEDNADLRVICKTILECRGYLALCAADGQEGYELARRHQPAVVLTDITMPVMDGREMAIRLRSDSTTAHIPIVAFSAAPVSERDRVAAGFAACVEKPFDPHRLVELLRDVIALRSAA